jgi:hypothetical protein
MNLSTHEALNDAELTDAYLIGAVVYGADDVKLGTVSHVHGLGASTSVIVDVGGFLGLGAKPVAMAANRLSFMRTEGGTVRAKTTWTKDQARALPEHAD